MIDELELHSAARVPLKFIGGGFAAVGGAAVATIGLMPLAIYTTIMKLSDIRDNTKYKELSTKFFEMGTQMAMIGARLDTIANSLEIIDDKFEKSKKAEDKLLFKQKKKANPEFLKKQVLKVESTGKGLIEACDVYLGLVKEDAMPRFKRDGDNITYDGLGLVRAVYDYEAYEAFDVSLRSGDVFEKLENSTGDRCWCKG